MIERDITIGRIVAASATLVLALAGCSSTGSTGSAPSTSTAAGSAAAATTSPAGSEGTGSTASIVAAATTFLGMLSATEKSSVLFDRNDKTQKQKWSNLPQGAYQRAGLMVGDLGQAKVDAFFAVMRATLSTGGYNRVMAEWTADDQLAGQGGGGFTFGKKYYWIAVIGQPSETQPWQWQFGGHHVTVNATVQGSAVSLTPSFIGAQPASYTSGGTTRSPLGDIDDAAFALVNSLGAARSRAVLGSKSIDLVLGPGQDCRTIPSEGLAGSAMTAPQQKDLLALIDKYGSLGTGKAADARLAQLKADLPKTSFAWYGPTTKGSAAYFRVTGPHVVIEYSPQSMGGNAANHIHGIYRDPTADYGGTVC